MNRRNFLQRVAGLLAGIPVLAKIASASKPAVQPVYFPKKQELPDSLLCGNTFEGATCMLLHDHTFAHTALRIHPLHSGYERIAWDDSGHPCGWLCYRDGSYDGQHIKDLGVEPGVAFRAVPPGAGFEDLDDSIVE